MPQKSVLSGAGFRYWPGMSVDMNAFELCGTGVRVRLYSVCIAKRGGKPWLTYYNIPLKARFPSAGMPLRTIVRIRNLGSPLSMH